MLSVIHSYAVLMIFIMFICLKIIDLFAVIDVSDDKGDNTLETLYQQGYF
jgi:hypothetical protein